MDEKVTTLRHSGIDIIGDVPWGTHFCQFYDTQQDLLDILVPYFKAGLEENEFCMWITSAPLNHKEAEQALRAAMPDFDSYVRKSAIEIIPHSEWYLVDGTFDKKRVLDGWVHKLEGALSRGLEGLRLSGNTFWLESSLWKDFYEYEAIVNSVIGRYRMIAACTYSLHMCGAAEVIDVVQNHQFSLIKRQGRWTVLEGSERRKASKELQDLNQQLEQRTIDLESAVQELQGFTYSVSHDLRAPLRAIDGYAKLLSQGYKDGLDEEGRRLLSVIRENSRRMGRIIDEILDFTRLGRIDLRPESMDMQAIVRSAWEEQAPRQRARELAVDALPAAWGDPILIRQVLANLLGNALKGTRNREAPRIEVGAGATDGEQVFFVRDNGIGFDARYVHRLFGLFQRLHDADEFPGNGVGLAIVKRIITRHGGRVWAEGRPGEGATFYFTLPPPPQA